MGCGGSEQQHSPRQPHHPTSSNAAVAECIQFLDNSYFWGSVRLADVRMGGTALGGTAVNERRWRLMPARSRQSSGKRGIYHGPGLRSGDFELRDH